MSSNSCSYFGITFISLIHLKYLENSLASFSSKGQNLVKIGGKHVFTFSLVYLSQQWTNNPGFG